MVGAVMGIAAGGPAGRAVFTHWSVMVKGQSQIFAAGPSVVERGIGRTVSKEELGGYKVAADNAGVIQNVAKSEEACFQQIRQFLSYLPSNIWELPPCKNVGDPVDRIEEELLDSKIDMAVHSLKDLPTKMTDGLCVNAVVKRNDPRDAFVSFSNNSFNMPIRRRPGLVHWRRCYTILT